eukprot:TRINITY_DN1002_c0_g2_i3.p1 TRINITY_DN1002_c0_g2~~TRINITY_DN1002_c0_g2_i3.p1  ORF type:complete len:474 (+),score=76.39 TRINITY_DN1002_c0_g2_i3:805-2226(+)
MFKNVSMQANCLNCSLHVIRELQETVAATGNVYSQTKKEKKKKEREREREREREMENGGERKWRFGPNMNLMAASEISIRGILNMLMENLDVKNGRPTIPLGHGDPSVFPCFRTTPAAEDAVTSTLRSAKFNCYAPTVGVLDARRAISEYLSRDLPYKLSPDDVYMTSGCTQAVETIISVLARPGANILLPRPGFPFYDARAAFSGIEIRYFDLLPEKSWEVDLDAVKNLADENTVAMVVINPGNPCGNVFSYQHLEKVAETAKKLGILVIADEVYDHLAFGNNPYVPMGVFGSIVPVITIGSISKRWVVPGWRLGWLVTNDPNGVLKKTKIVDCIVGFLNISSDPATFIQAAVPQILQNTTEDFFNNILHILSQTADICYNRINEISCITCPHKPEGSMFAMVKLDQSLLEDISDDVDFCCKLAKEESVLILPGSAVGMKNWLRVTFAVEPSSLEDGLGRLKSFCDRHLKQF